MKGLWICAEARRPEAEHKFQHQRGVATLKAFFMLKAAPLNPAKKFRGLHPDRLHQAPNAGEPDGMFRNVVAYLVEQNKFVEPLYEMDKNGQFSGDGEKGLQGVFVPRRPTGQGGPNARQHVANRVTRSTGGYISRKTTAAARRSGFAAKITDYAGTPWIFRVTAYWPGAWSGRVTDKPCSSCVQFTLPP